jgi:preprotein translocase subunit SecG
LETGLYIALIIVSFALIGLVILQGRNAGLQARDSSSIYRTKRGLEKTIHQATIVLAAVFLILALITSLPLFGTPAPVVAPTGVLNVLGLF